MSLLVWLRYWFRSSRLRVSLKRTAPRTWTSSPAWYSLQQNVTIALVSLSCRPLWPTNWPWEILSSASSGPLIPLGESFAVLRSVPLTCSVLCLSHTRLPWLRRMPMSTVFPISPARKRVWLRPLRPQCLCLLRLRRLGVTLPPYLLREPVVLGEPGAAPDGTAFFGTKVGGRGRNRVASLSLPPQGGLGVPGGPCGSENYDRGSLHGFPFRASSFPPSSSTCHSQQSCQSPLIPLKMYAKYLLPLKKKVFFKGIKGIQRFFKGIFCMHLYVFSFDLKVSGLVFYLLSVIFSPITRNLSFLLSFLYFFVEFWT